MEESCPGNCPKLRSSLFANVPPFVQFYDSSSLVSEELEISDTDDGEAGSLVWAMWLPSINQTVVRTVQEAGYRVARVGSRDYSQLQGGIWDFADGPLEEQDFHNLNRLVRNTASYIYDEYCIQSKINRMPGSHFLCRKDKLAESYRWLQSKAGKAEDRDTKS